MEIFAIIGGLGLACGFVSGLIGIGGGIIMAPLLLFVPQCLGQPPLDMQTVAGLTIIQGLAACVSGAVIHRRFHVVSKELTLWMGGAIFVAALAGGAGAKFLSNHVLLLVFGGMALAASILMLRPPPDDREHPRAEDLVFSRLRAAAAAAAVGFFGGLVGQGGSFILIPLMTAFVGIPTRIAIGSNLAIILFSSAAAAAGKAATGQIAWPLTIPIVVTVIPAAALGGVASHRMPVRRLRQFLAVIIAAAAVKILLSALGK